MENANIEVTLTQKDVYLYKKSFILKTKNIVFFYGVLALIEIYLISRYYTDLFKVSIVILLPLLFIVGFLFQLNKDAKKALDNNPHLQNKQLFIFNDEGVKVVTTKGDFVTKWEDIRKAIEYKHSISLFLTKNQAHIIPLRCIEDGQLNTIREYLKKIKETEKK